MGVGDIRNVSGRHRAAIDDLKASRILEWCEGELVMAAKSLSMKAIPVAPQSISACVAMVWLPKEILHNTTRCFPSIATLETDKLDKKKDLLRV